MIKWLLPILLVSFVLAAAPTEPCEGVASDTEWQLAFVNSVYNSASQTTTFTYTLTTLASGDDACPAKNCQDLSHWVLLTGCDDSVGSPSGSFGPDGRRTIDGEIVVGYKWETSSTVGKTLTYTLTVPGNVPESTIQYLVKGATRCGYGTIEGPATCSDVPPQPECVVDADCADDWACTSDRCIAGVCSRYPVDSECVVEGSCVQYACQPDAANADSEGCVQVALDDSVCQDSASCSNNWCDPTNNMADSRNCVVQLVHNRCKDQYSCTLNQCAPSAAGANAETGCVVTLRDSECDDGASCSDNLCNPALENADSQTGCANFYYDDRCVDTNQCSDDTCSPLSEASNSAGCVYEANNAPCDDADECTGTVAGPDACADFECVPGDAVCPYFSGSVFAGQYFPAGRLVATNNETHVLIRWDSDNSGWTTQVIHIYVGSTAPTKLAPGKFPTILNLASPVSQLSVAVPLPNACNMNGPIYFAFHIEAISGTGSPICILRNGKQTCSGVTETGWFKGEYQPPKNNNWGSYTQFDACCCAGFSHVKTFRDEKFSVDLLSSLQAKVLIPDAEDQDQMEEDLSTFESSASMLFVSAVLCLLVLLF